MGDGIRGFGLRLFRAFSDSLDNDKDSSSDTPSYRGFPPDTNMRWGGVPNVYYQGGPRLGAAQNDMFYGQYYQRGATYSGEVDMQFGGRTQSATLRLQADLIAAGVYNGPASGAFDPQTIAALGQLTQRGIPPGTDPAVADRLSRFLSASQQPPTPYFSRDAYQNWQRPPVSLKADADGLTDQGVKAVVTYLAGQTDFGALMQQGQVNPQAFAQQIADAAKKLQDDPNSRRILRRAGLDQLGFNTHRSEAQIDADLDKIRQYVLGANSQPAANPADAETRIQNMVKLLGVAVRPDMTPAQANEAMASFADTLAAMPDTRGFFMGISKDLLGFDPAKNSEGEIDTFLKGVSDTLRYGDAKAPVLMDSPMPGQNTSQVNA